MNENDGFAEAVFAERPPEDVSEIKHLEAGPLPTPNLGYRFHASACEEEKPKSLFDIAELQRINLGPNDVLSVKLIGDEFDQSTIQSLRNSLQGIFTKNKVMIFAMPTKTDILFEAISPTETSAESAESENNESESQDP